ncbi:MAG: 3-deoxy-D-manno-octulosonic acid transferase, partial [Endozoicomonadaceae bacterium]|nr:3-deoxy-D-manno-octulosonic acid transferase [Endozoicomonadaceae bacterium]
PLMVANARLSERSFKKYAKAGKAVKNMLESVDILAAQHEKDGQRFLKLGLAPEKLHITGSVKYDIKPPKNIREQGKKLRNTWLKNKTESTKIIIAVSTHNGEEALLLPVFRAIKQQINDVLFVIVPRHPQRFDEVNKLGSTCFQCIRRSKNEPVTEDTDMIIADTMGEMFLLLSACDIVFMGGTLVPVGGHNFMEPAVLALPQIAGPHVFNFQAVADYFQSGGALTIVSDTEELKENLISLLQQPQRGIQMGEAALKVVKQQQGALDKHLKLIERIMCKHGVSTVNKNL